MLDCHLTMNVSTIARTCYLELRRLAFIRRFLTSTATATLVPSVVLSRIDHCYFVQLMMLHSTCTDTELFSSNNLANSKISQHNHTFKITALV